MPDYNKKDVYLPDFDSANAAASSFTGLESFSTKDVVQDIRNSYLPQKTSAQNKDKEILKDFFSMQPSSSYTYGAPVAVEEKAGFTERNYNPEELYTTLRNGEMVKKFDTYTPGIDNYENHAQNQSTAEKWKNGVTKAVGQTVTGIIGGTLGTVYGVEEGIRQGSLRATYDNDFGNYLDDLNEKWDAELPNFYKQSEKEMGFFESMGTANFWAKDVLGGAAFTVSAIGSELIWDFATGGAAAAVSAARLGAKFERYLGKATNALGKLDDIARAKNLTIAPIRNTFNKAQEAVKTFSTATMPTNLAIKFGKAGSLANTARFTYTSAGFEAGFEARHYIREEEDKFYTDFEKKNGKKPEAADIKDFQKNLTDSANALYGFNLAVVGSSNLATIGKIFDFKSPIKSPNTWINSKLFGVGVKSGAGEITAQVATKGQKIAQYAYSISKPMIMEGLYEEGLQSVGSNTAKNWIGAKYDPKLTEDTYSLGNAMADAFSETYGTKEGFKEVGIGMIVGMLTGHGINLAKGQGLNAEFSNEKYRAEGLENMAKYYSPKKMAETFAYSNRMQMANNSESTAKQKGDFVGGELARQSATIAQLNYAYNLEYMDEVVGDSVISIKNIDNETLMKQYGVDEAGAENLKKSMIEEYQDTAKSYKKYRDFAEYYVGDKLKAEDSLIGKNGTLGEHNAKSIKEAIAYELTLGEKAHSFSGDILQAIKETVARTVVGEGVAEALDIDDILTKAGKDAKAKSNNTIKQIEKTKEEITSIENEYKQLKKTYDNSVSDEDKKTILNKLDALTSKKQDLTEKKEQLRKEFEILVNTSKMQNPFTKDKGTVVISGETLDNFVNRSQQVKELITSFDKISPQDALHLKKLVQEYGRSISAFQRYSDLSKQLSNPKLGLRGKRNIVLEIMRDKTPSEVTVETLTGLLDKDRLTERGAEALAERIGDTEMVKEEVDKVREAAKAGATIPKPTAEQTEDTKEEEIQAIKDEYDAKIAELSKISKTTKLKEQDQKGIKSSETERLEEEYSDNYLRTIIDPKKDIDYLSKIKEKYGLDYFEVEKELKEKYEKENQGKNFFKKFKDGFTDDMSYDPNYIFKKRLKSIIFSKATPEIEGITEEQEIEDLEEIKRLEEERKAKLAEVEKKYPKPAEEKKTLTEEVIDILESSPYLVEYVGTNVSELQPTEEEITEFRDLAERAINDPKVKLDTIAFKNPYGVSNLPMGRKIISLSKEEVSKLQELNNKMANWQLLQSAANQSGVSIKQIIEQDIARKAKAAEKGPGVKLTDTELVTNTTISDDESNLDKDGNKSRNEEALQVAEGSYISKGRGGKRSIHYYTISGLVNRMQEVKSKITIFKTEKVGNKEVVIDSTRKEILKSELPNYSIPGYHYQLAFEDGTSVEIKMERSSALSLKNQADLEVVLNSADIEYIESTLNANGGYITIYDKLTGEKLPTDFEVEDSYSPGQIYDIAPGESVFFNLDMTDPYNLQLLEEYNQEIKDNVRDPKEVLSDFKDSIKINVVDSSDNSLGILKANYDTRDLSNFMILREKAAELALEPVNIGKKATIPFTTTVKYIFLGSPNHSFEEGILKYYDIKPDLVKGYGYISNGELVLKGVKASAVRKEYVKKLYNREGTPVVVLQQGKYLVAFPLNLIETELKLGDQLKEKLLGPDNIADTVLELNQKLLENGLSPRKYNLFFVSEENQTLFGENGDSSEKLTEAINDLNVIKETADVKTWMDRNHTAKDLVTQANIGLDMTRDAFSSPKPIIDFMGETFTATEADQEYRDSQKAENVVDEVLAIAEKSSITLREEAEKTEEKKAKVAAAKRSRSRVNNTKQEVKNMGKQQEETQDVNEEIINNFDIEAAADEIVKENKSSEDYRKNKPKFDC